MGECSRNQALEVSLSIVRLYCSAHAVKATIASVAVGGTLMADSDAT
ncbi:MAG: hypothetical protein BMS9Abin37_0703 [Acidobacteriota bacterium]|nr:MAG: hypothetical protein BMS9Abin37_0703 [Acidobacteriota bacterium]